MWSATSPSSARPGRICRRCWRRRRVRTTATTWSTTRASIRTEGARTVSSGSPRRRARPASASSPTSSPTTWASRCRGRTRGGGRCCDSAGRPVMPPPSTSTGTPAADGSCSRCWARARRRSSRTASSTSTPPRPPMRRTGCCATSSTSCRSPPAPRRWPTTSRHSWRPRTTSCDSGRTRTRISRIADSSRSPNSPASGWSVPTSSRSRIGRSSAGSGPDSRTGCGWIIRTASSTPARIWSSSPTRPGAHTRSWRRSWSPARPSRPGGAPTARPATTRWPSSTGCSSTRRVSRRWTGWTPASARRPASRTRSPGTTSSTTRSG